MIAFVEVAELTLLSIAWLSPDAWMITNALPYALSLPSIKLTEEARSESL